MPDRNGNMTPEEMFNQMMEEQAKMMTPSTPQPPTMPTGKPGSPPVLSSEEQRVLNELTSKPSVRNTGSHPSQVASALPQCPECGMMHPPLKPGEKCGNAPSAGGPPNANVVDLDMVINKYLVNLKNISVSQIQSKGIKDVNKLLQYLTLEMTKLLEGYNE